MPLQSVTLFLARKKLLITLISSLFVLLFLVLALVIGLMRLHHGFASLPVSSSVNSYYEVGAVWWADPAPLSEDEVAAQQWLADMTYRLSPDDEGIWDVGGTQHGVFSIRYQAAFAGYATAVLGMRTPAYTGLTQAILDDTVARLADRKSWRYISRGPEKGSVQFSMYFY